MNIDHILIKIGRQVKMLRKKHYPDDSQATFAVRIKVSIHTYRRIEKGDSRVSFAHYVEVAKLYNMEENLLKIFAPKLSDINLFEDDLSQF